MDFFKPVKNWELNKRVGGKIGTVKYRSFGYDLGFSLTFEKRQSKSYNQLIVDLQMYPRMSLTFEKLLVSLSRYKIYIISYLFWCLMIFPFRVSCMDNIRILPFSIGQTMLHITRLRPDPHMLLWLSGFDQHGKWNALLAKKALSKYPLQTKKGKTTVTQQKSSNPLSQSAQTSKNSTRTTAQKNNTDSSTRSQSASSHRVLRRFQLNIQHAIQSAPDRLFSAYFVPYDGHCLFKAFQEALQIETSVQELRTQVVREISLETDAAIRISALNAHIAREGEHNNPRWQNVELLDAGTVFMPGEMDIQFSHLWVQYADEMSNNAWAGTQT